jgi:acyl-CoA synthetase (AMP-forming)/AMP-acid ligase II
MLTLATRAEAGTLLDMARRQLALRPDSTALIFVPDDGTPARSITTRAFFAGAAQYAEALRKAGVGGRDLVILVMDHREALLYAFWGAMLLGAIPSIFPFLSDKLDPALYFERVKLLITHAGARAVIASPAFVEPLAALLAETGVTVIGSDHLATDSAPVASLPATPDIAPNDVAFLQHSSGTTGLQKGVALPHCAVLNQIASYSAAIQLSAEDVIVSWLPLYHDMGLIAGFVLPIAQGVPLVLLSPFHWVRDPKVLMQAIHAHGGTLCWLPNFAYNHMALRIREGVMDGLRLESMRAFINCSEPMYAASHRQFMARFEQYGLRPDALATCYAMAENTFAVTQGFPRAQNGTWNVTVDVISRTALQDQHRALPAGADDLRMEMLSCGVPIPNCAVQIVDEARLPLPERWVGEVAVRSDSMLSGYYRRDDLTATVMHDGWYLTGDYGYLADGELYITGRKKDLIIVGGKNVYPQDLEAIANEVPGVHRGRAVAFGVDDPRLGTETVVMVVEAAAMNGDLDDDACTAISKEVRRRVAQETEITLSDVLVVDSRWLHKTSSGKTARGASRDKYLQEIGR